MVHLLSSFGTGHHATSAGSEAAAPADQTAQALALAQARALRQRSEEWGSERLHAVVRGVRGDPQHPLHAAGAARLRATYAAADLPGNRTLVVQRAQATTTLESHTDVPAGHTCTVAHCVVMREEFCEALTRRLPPGRAPHTTQQHTQATGSRVER